MGGGTASQPLFKYGITGTANVLLPVGVSKYHSLQTTLNRRMSNGLSMQVAYTWSHALDEISEYRAAVLDDFTNKRADYGNGDFDTRHLFTLNFTYDVPTAAWATSARSRSSTAPASPLMLRPAT